MAKFTDYTQKTKPADADLLLIHDNAGAANKKTPFSGVWSWILDKLASAVISQLETTNKSIIPAINELNSNKIANVANVKYQSVSLDDITDTFAILRAISITDIPSDIKSDLAEWVLVSTFKLPDGTGVQFITSLFMITNANAKIYKRHLAAGAWSNFRSIN